MNSAYAYIAIIDPPGDITAVTDRVGLPPTKIKRKGDRIPGTIMVQKHDCWILESPTPREDFDLDHHVRDLLTLIEPKKDRVREAVGECYGRLTLVGYFEHANDGFRISRQQLALVVDMGLEVDCDLYFIGSDQEPNKAPEPTPGSVMPRAEPRVTPAPRVAHL